MAAKIGLGIIVIFLFATLGFAALILTMLWLDSGKNFYRKIATKQTPRYKRVLYVLAGPIPEFMSTIYDACKELREEFLDVWEGKNLPD